MDQIRGYRFDFEKFEKLKKENWFITETRRHCCRMHHTYFEPLNEQEGEPCWQCHDSCIIWDNEEGFNGPNS